MHGLRAGFFLFLRESQNEVFRERGREGKAGWITFFSVFCCDKREIESRTEKKMRGLHRGYLCAFSFVNES